MTTPSLLSTLRALEQAATKGPWRAYVGCKVRTEPLSRDAWRADQVKDQRDMATIADCALSVLVTPETYPIGEANTALIAALRNAAPAILDALKAAEEVLCELRDRSEAKKALIDALAALDAGGE